MQLNDRVGWSLQWLRRAHFVEIPERGVLPKEDARRRCHPDRRCRNESGSGPHLSDGSINDTALFDAIGCRDATSEDFGYSCYTIFIMFPWHHLGSYLCRLLLCILE